MIDWTERLRGEIARVRAEGRTVVGIVIAGDGVPVLHRSHTGLPESEPTVFIDDVAVWCDDELAHVFAQS